MSQTAENNQGTVVRIRQNLENVAASGALPEISNNTVYLVVCLVESIILDDFWGRSRLFFPLPTTVRALHFMPRRFQLFLPSSTRVELCFTHARRSQQLILFSFFFLQINSKSRHGGFRTHGPTLLVAFEGYLVYNNPRNLLVYCSSILLDFIL